MVDDDDGDGFPSPEPRTDSRSALPRKNRAWGQLHLVDRNNSVSLIFLEICDFIVSGGRQQGHQVGTAHLGAPGEGGMPWWVVPTQVPLSGRSWLQKFLILI